MTGAVLGVDIGASGALALLDDNGDVVAVADMPTLDDGPKGRRSVNGPLLASLIARWEPSKAFTNTSAHGPGKAL